MGWAGGNYGAQPGNNTGLPLGTIYYDSKTKAWMKTTSQGPIEIPDPTSTGARPQDEFSVEVPDLPTKTAESVFSPFVDPLEEAADRRAQPLGLAQLRIPKQ